MPSEREVRGIARYDAEAVDAGAGLRDLMPDGVLALPSIQLRASATRASSSWMATAWPTACPTTCHLRAAADPLLAARRRLRARGLLLQQLPPHHQTEAEERAESWNHLLTLADNLTAEELLGLDNPTLLHRLYPWKRAPVRAAKPAAVPLQLLA